MPEPARPALKQRLAQGLQMLFGLLLLIVAVSTDLDFTESRVVHVDVLRNFTWSIWLPALATIAIKAAIAFTGSHLLTRKTLVLTPS